MGATALPQVGAVSESMIASGAIRRQFPSRCSRNHSRLRVSRVIQSSKNSSTWGAHNLHEIAGKTIASGCVYMENAKPGVKTQSGSSQPGFGFKHGIKIVEHGIRRVDC